jgi:hypothetical protein
MGEAFLFALQQVRHRTNAFLLDRDGWNKREGSFVPNDEQDAGFEAFSFRRWHGNTET